MVTTAEAEDAVSELLSSVAGLPSTAYHDLKKCASHVSVFLELRKFSPARTRRAIIAGLEYIKNCGLNLGAAKIEIARMKREDWAESWKRHFKPIEIKSKRKKPRESQRSPKLNSLLVKPTWSKKQPAPDQAVVVLDPGLSFGTGQHPTTGFCLHQIVDCLNPGEGQSFLDIGTGSGILAIAASKLGYTSVEAFDFDPEAVRVAKENIRANGVSRRVKLTRGDVTKLPLKPVRKFDLVCANLISTLLIAERKRILNRLKPGGTLVLAGILASEFAQVEQAFADLNLRLRASRKENEWRSGAFCFR